MQSKYKKTMPSHIKVVSGAPVSGVPLRMDVKKSGLFSELRVCLAITQTCTTGATTFDPRKFIANIAVETGDGKVVNLDGYQAYDLARLTEGAPSPTYTLGTSSSCYIVMDIHLENDGAEADLLTAARFIDAVTITMCAAADSGFIGGTAQTALVTAADIEAISYPDMVGHPGVALATHYSEHFTTINGTVAANSGIQPDINMSKQKGTACRFLLLHCYSVSGGVATPSDAVITNIRLKHGNREPISSTYASIQKKNIAERGLNVPGLVVLDMGPGDTESEWLDFNEAEASLGFDVAAGAPTNFRVTVARDRTVVK